MAEKKNKNLNATLTYVGGWITGLIFLLIEKEDENVRFHAAQSVVIFGGLTIFTFIPILGQLLSIVLWPLALILWVVLIVKTYQGEKMELPMVSDFAKNLEKKIGKQN